MLTHHFVLPSNPVNPLSWGRCHEGGDDTLPYSGRGMGCKVTPFSWDGQGVGLFFCKYGLALSNVCRNWKELESLPT